MALVEKKQSSSANGPWDARLEAFCLAQIDRIAHEHPDIRAPHRSFGTASTHARGRKKPSLAQLEREILQW